jgi:hypothetical protein
MPIIVAPIAGILADRIGGRPLRPVDPRRREDDAEMAVGGEAALAA